MIPVVVLSMPRSGTSLLANILGRMGGALPNGMIPPHAEFNPNGFFESGRFLDIRVALEAALRINFSFPVAWSRPDWSVLDGQGMRELVDAAAAAFSEVYPKSAEFCIFKDPRTAALLPFWQRVFARLDVRPIYIMAVRHPAAVARSVEAFNGVPRRLTELLWIETKATILEFLRGTSFLCVHYEKWCDDSQLEELHAGVFSRELGGGRRRMLRDQVICDRPGMAWPVASPAYRLSNLAAELYEMLARLPTRVTAINDPRALRQAADSQVFLRDIGAYLYPDDHERLLAFDARAQAYEREIARIRDLTAEFSAA